MSGLALSFLPRGLPGLEIGADRFFHTGWPRRGIFKAPWYRPFEGILKQSLSTSTNPMGDDVGDNQEASAFARWAFPGHGIEVYGEYAREDHNYDLRDLLQEPDHESGFMLGIHDNPQGVTGVDLVTGTVFHATGLTRDRFIAVPSGGFTETSVNRFHIQATTGDQSFIVSETYHITVTPDGKVTAYVDNVSSTC